MVGTDLQLARQQLLQERQKLSQSEYDLAKQQSIYANPNLLRQNRLGYLLAPKYKSQLLDARGQISQAQSDIQSQGTELNTFENQVSQQEQDQARIDYLQTKASQYQKRGDIALYGVSKQDRNIIKNLSVTTEDYAQRQKGLQTLQSFKDQGLNPVVRDGKIVGFEDTTGQRSINVNNLPRDVVQRLQNIPGLTKISTDIRSPPPAETSQVRPFEIIPQGVESEYIPPSFFYPEGKPSVKNFSIGKILPDPFPRYYYEKGRAKQALENFDIPNELKGPIYFGAGLVSGGIAAALEFPLYAILHPIRTIKSIVSVPLDIATGAFTEAFGEAFNSNPLYSLGYITALGKPGLKATSSVLDISIPKTPEGELVKVSPFTQRLTGFKYDIFPRFTFSDFSLPAFKLPSVGNVIQDLPFIKKPEQRVPGPNEIKAIETGLMGDPTNRERATILLKDKYGNYILDNSGKESSIVISFGGGIESNETPKKAAIRELQQESGLVFSNLKSEGRQVFPEEIHHVFTGVLSDEQLNKLRNIKKIGPKEYQGIRGQTAKNPVELDGVRVYELALINWIESGKKQPITFLFSNTPQGEYVYGTKSRYNIAKGGIEAYDIGEELALAHGTPNIPVVQFLPGEGITKKFTVLGSESKRGEQGLYTQPPISPKPFPKDVKKLVDYTGEGDFIRDTKELKNLPFNVPKSSPPGYIGLSYLDIGPVRKVRLSLLPKFGSRGALLLSEKIDRFLKVTNKALTGQESETLFTVGTEIRTTGRRQVEYISGKRVLLQPAEVAREFSESLPKKIDNLVKFNTRSEEPIRYASITRYLFAKSYAKSNKDNSSDTLKETRKSAEKYLGKIEYQEAYYIGRETGLPEYKSYYFSQPYSGKYYGGGDYLNSYLKEPPEIPRIPIVNPPYNKGTKKDSDERKRRAKRLSRAYILQIKRRGKFVSIATGLPRGRALKLGQDRALAELSRQFKIVESGVTNIDDFSFVPSQKAFRTYKVRGGKQIPLEADRFIQNISANLQTQEEKALIKAARLSASRSPFAISY